MASIQASVPDNKSFLSPIGFQFSVKRLPHVNYFCTNASIPNVSLTALEVETPFIKIPVPGDKLSFGAFNIRFRVDEDMRNFQEIFDWMVALGYPDRYEQRRSIQRSTIDMGDVYSDASLMIMTNQYRPNIEVKFLDIYPIELSSLDFNIEETDLVYLQGDATFAYRKYELNTVL